jgi:hypothetical protein
MTRPPLPEPILQRLRVLLSKPKAMSAVRFVIGIPGVRA